MLELGDQLIKDEGIALFELVKNAYDADSTDVSVDMLNIDSQEKGEIIITDNGVGMNKDLVLNVWLEPGTNYRQKQVSEGKKTKEFKRTPLGEKGIGRFGAHKLGKKIELITKSRGCDEVCVVIDWEDFEKDKYLEDIDVEVIERKPIVFTGNKTGTRIKISNLRSSWNRGMVRDIYRAINSICSPTKSPDSFFVKLAILDKDKSDWLENLFSWNDIVKYKLFHAVCTIDGDRLSYTYEFTPWEVMHHVEGRKAVVPMSKALKIADSESKNKDHIDLSKYKIGKVTFELNIYDLESEILSLASGKIDKTGLKEFLKFNGGIRVYRDNMRVYDYGESGNDWLELGTRRVNLPTERISNNIVLGQVNLDRSLSADLIEKTNREGFIENDAVKALRKAIVFAIVQVESERKVDKTRLRSAYSSTKGKLRELVLDDITDLRKKLEKKKLDKEFGPDLDKIENNFKDIREKLLTSAGAGLSLSIVIHEIQKIIDELKAITNQDKGGKRVKTLVQRLSELTEGYAILVRQEGKLNIKATDLIKAGEFNVDYRLKAHKVEILKALDKFDFKINCSRRLIVGAIMNIIDNSIWWLDNKNPEKKYIYISTTNELKEGPAIIIADNGSGFRDDIEYMTQPFFTRKPDGMGLGLHIVDEVMKVHKGSIKILQQGDIRLPKEISGAILALIFPKAK